MSAQVFVHILAVCHLTLLALNLGSVAATESTSEQNHIVSDSSGTSVSSTKETFFTWTAPDFSQVSDSRNTRSRDTNLGQNDKTLKRKKNSQKKKLRALDIVADDTCTGWKPFLNIAIDTENSSLTVEYCLKEGLLAPTTYTCITKSDDFILCTIIEQPQCGHKFENLTSGNYTIHIQALCKTCFAKIIYNTKCDDTPVFVKSVIFEDLLYKQEQLTQARNEQSVSTKDENGLNVVAIICAICGVIVICGVLLVVYLRKHHKRNVQLSTRHSDTTSQVIPLSSDRLNLSCFGQTDVKQKYISSTVCRKQETSFISANEPTVNEALLHSGNRGQTTPEQPQPDLSYFPSYVSNMRLVSWPSNSDFSEGSDLEIVRRNLPLQNTDDYSDSLDTDLGRVRIYFPLQSPVTSYDQACSNDNCRMNSGILMCSNEETLTEYFDTVTGITLNEPSMNTLPKPLIEIPYHLINRQ
uniref:Uncharacterized protein n=1 Tax=Arion vulgaris TaxID=1028688 RepID=A0A0B7A9G5_9EUPU